MVVNRGVEHPLDKAIIQRAVLSFVPSLFGPFKFVAPYTEKIRLLL